MIPAHADAEFLTPGGVDDDVIAVGEALAVGVEKVNFLPGTELDVHDLHIRLGAVLICSSIEFAPYIIQDAVCGF